MSTTNHYHIAIVGPADMVSGFKALGIDAFDASTEEETLEQLRTLKTTAQDPTAPRRYAIVCVIESLLADVDPNEYAKVVSGPLPAVVPLPGPEGSTGLAIDRLRRLAEQAVGSAII